MMRAASRVHRKVPVRLTLMTFSHSSSGMWTREGLLDPGVVDQQVEPAEGLADLGEAALDIGLDRDVHLDGHGAPAGGLDGGDHRAAVVDLAAAVDRHRGAVGGELERGTLADAAGGGGDQGAPPFEQARVGCMEAEVAIGHPHRLPH